LMVRLGRLLIPVRKSDFLILGNLIPVS
jgi:hypothetical protein